MNSVTELVSEGSESGKLARYSLVVDSVKDAENQSRERPDVEP
jgi:hypothetical protein